MSDIKEKLSKISELVTESRPQAISYADAIRAPPPVPTLQHKRQSPCGVIVASKNTNISSQEIESKIKQTVDLKSIKIEVKKIKTITNQRVFLGTADETECKTLEKELVEKLGEDCKVSLSKPITPQLILTNIEKDYSEKELWLEIKETNYGFGDNDRIKSVHKKKYTSKKDQKQMWSYFI